MIRTTLIPTLPTDNGAREVYPRFSPGGRRIAFPSSPLRGREDRICGRHTPA